MRTRSLLLAAVCVLILTSTFDCKKPTKEIKNKKTKEIKQQKGKITEAEKVKAEPVNVEKLKVEKPKTEKVKVAEVEEVQKTAHEELTKSDAVHTNVFESPLETAVNNHQSDTIKPKSLKALTAYDQCKIECRKQRDHIIAQEYVEQLRQELAAAEAILTEQAATTSIENAPADKSESSNHQP